MNLLVPLLLLSGTSAFGVPRRPRGPWLPPSPRSPNFPWYPRRPGDSGWNPPGSGNGGWNPRGLQEGGWYPPGTQGGGWYPPGTQEGGWNPPGPQEGGWYPPGTQEGGWYPPGTQGGGWYPPGTEEGGWYPPGPQDGGWYPPGPQDGGWNPRRPEESSWLPSYFRRRQPCNDFTEAICAAKELRPLKLKQEYEDTLLSAFSNYEIDDVTQELFDAVKGFSVREPCQPMPKKPNGKRDRAEFVGQLSAYGMMPISVKIDPSSKTVELRLQNNTATPPTPHHPQRIYGFETTTVPVKDLPEHLKYFLFAYFETVDVENRFHAEEFDVAFEKDVEEFSEFTESSLVFKSLVEIEHLRNFNFHGLSAVSALRNSRFLAIGLHFDEMDWISAESKEKLKNVHTIDDYLFGPSEKFLNQTMVDKALKFYQDYFRKMRPFADENMKKLAVRPHCKPAYYETLLKQHTEKFITFSFGYLSVNECKPIYYDRVFRVADAAFRLYYNYDFGHYSDKASYSFNFFANRAFNNLHGNKLVFGYPFIFGYQRRDLSLGYLYGSIGRVIAHEIFHSYGVNEIMTDGVKDIFDNRIYQSGISCVRNYYSSFAHPQFGAPNGTLKANEGFADLHAAMAIYGLVTRGNLMDYNSTHQSPIRNIYDVMRDVFIGTGSFYCDEYLYERANPDVQKGNLLNFPHPRHAIRMNAIFKQLPMFTKMFQCKPGDANYRADNLCNAFPTIGKPKLLS